MKKILLTGASGFLGWNLFRALKNLYQVTGTYASHQPPTQEARTVRLDLRESAATEKIIGQIFPDIVIHTAALTSPAECMSNPRTAWKTNVLGTINIARAAARAGCRLIYISTDRVFNGRKGNYVEEDLPDPLGCYEKTKFEGEKRVQKIAPDSLILRLPLMYGMASPFHGSFVAWMIEGFVNKTPLGLFVDQFRTPLYVGDAFLAIDRLLNLTDLKGLFHLGGGERVNRADFGFKMAEIFGFDSGCIHPIVMADKPHIPPTPADVSLNSDKLFQAIGFRARGVKEGLRAFKKDVEFADNIAVSSPRSSNR